MEHDKYLTVGAITKYLKYKFDSDEHLRVVYLKGEISNFKAHTTGHFYFSIKDETSKINAIMFSANARKVTFTPADGTKVLVTGRISVYEATGGYQIYVEQMEEDGVGNLYVAFEKLKKELAQEGLFDVRYKKPIPKIPSKIGIVTAPTGAAIKDILSTIKRRYPLCETYLFPALVQGENAAKDIVKKIKQAESYGLDTLIIGRGGGSIEDLWPFNEEIVARAIFACKTPIISAVGHEIDFTISDFVSDLRAPTPTGAAELAVPNLIDLTNYINQLKIRLQEGMNKELKYNMLYLDSLKSSFVIKSPMIMYENKKQKVDMMLTTLSTFIVHQLERSKVQLEQIHKNYILTNPKELYKMKEKELGTIIQKLELLNPLNVLKRGYTLVYQENQLVGGIHELTDHTLDIQFHDGIVRVKPIKKIEK